MLERSRGGTIIGNVIGSLNRPIPEAAVIIGGDSPRHNDIAALTDEQGEFIFDNLLPGKYTITVTASGFRSKQQQIEAYIGEEILITVVLEST